MVTDPELSPFRQSLSRIIALIRKETRQIMRDPGSILIGVFMPIMLLLIFGYGISFDIKNLPIAVVAEDNSQKSRDIISGFQLSQYFEVIPATSMEQAETLLRKRSVNGILRIPLNFEKDFFPARAISSSLSMARMPIRPVLPKIMHKELSAEFLPASRRKPDR